MIYIEKLLSWSDLLFNKTRQIVNVFRVLLSNK